MDTKKFDTFISYRRDGGSVLASRIYDNLLLKGFSPFYDITEMQAGRFDEQIASRIANAGNFILILSCDALNRCVDENDWLRKEIVLATKYQLNIVVIQDKNFIFPSELPEGLEKLPLYQSIVYDPARFHDVIEDVCKFLLKAKDPFAVSQISNSVNYGSNLSGEYITLYEDTEGERKVIRKAPATLKRIGNKVIGETNFGDSQSWKIRGTVYKKKRIGGTYFAENALDDGFGTFFLEIRNNGILDGFWSGYDNINGTITSGRYLFKKKFKNYVVKPAKKEHFIDICKIADEQLGENYITIDVMNNILDNGQRTYCMCAIDKTTKRVIAFSIYSFINSETAASITEHRISELKYAQNIGYLKTIAVNSAYASLGIGTSLVNYCVDQMTRLNVDLLISTAWKHAGVINIGGVLEKAGFSKRLEIEDYWLQSSIEEGYQCPQCGNPCHCSCIIYTANGIRK